MTRVTGKQGLVCGQAQQNLEVLVVFSDDVLWLLHLHGVDAVQAIENSLPKSLACTFFLGLEPNSYL